MKHAPRVAMAAAVERQKRCADLTVMRPLADIRKGLLTQLASALAHPTMYGGELYFSIRLHDLAFIDQSEDRLAVVLDELQDAGISTSIGVRGSFVMRFPSTDRSDFDGEVASVYGRVAARLGWFDVGRTLDHSAMAHVKRAASRLARRDVTWEDVSSELGAPSCAFGDVRAYAADVADAGWVFFDFTHVPHKPGHHSRDTAPPSSLKLRDVRLPIRSWYSQRFLYSPRGRAIRKP